MGKIERDVMLFLQSEEITRKGKICLYSSQEDLFLKPNNEKAVDSTAI